MDLCAHQMVEKQVALNVVVVAGAGQVKMTFQTQLGARGGSLTAVVRLHPSPPHKNVGALMQSVSEEKLVVARLVAAEEDACAVVALEEQPRPTDAFGEAWGLLHRCRQMGQADARQLRDAAPQFLGGQSGMSHGIPDWFRGLMFVVPP